MNKKIMSLILMSTVMVSLSLTSLATPANAATLKNEKLSVNSTANKVSKSGKVSTQELINNIEPYVVVDDNGKVSLSSSTPAELYSKYDLNSLKNWFATLNKEVDNGNLNIKDDLTIEVNNNKVELAASLMSSSSGQIGVSKSCDGTCRRVNYWWGQSLEYDRACAKTAISKAKQGARTLGLLGVAGGGFGTAIPAYWMDSWASDMEDNLADNGVICDLNYTFAYNCYGRY